MNATFAHSMCLNYPGDARNIVGEIKGPNLLDEYFLAVEAAHDAAADRTRVKFEHVTAGQVAREIMTRKDAA